MRMRVIVLSKSVAVHRSVDIGHVYLLAVVLAAWNPKTNCATLLNWPQDLDGSKDNSSVVVAGSVIQLFCSASGQFTAPHIRWTRNNITIPETAQLPHLMIKSRKENNTITSSLLTIYGFSSSDNGSYHCIASDIYGFDVSFPLLLSATTGSNVLKITKELNKIACPDQTSVPLGSSNISINGAFLRCSAEQPASSSFTAPSMMWLKDGTQLFDDGVRVVITTTNSTIAASNRTVSFVRIFNFSQSDAGVYQCVFYNTPSQGGEVITTRPYKVDTGSPYLKIIGLPVVASQASQPVVLQVEAMGEYDSIQWQAPSIGSGVGVDFNQTYVWFDALECGVLFYEVDLVVNNSHTLSVNFTVTTTCSTLQKSTSSYFSTTAVSSSMVIAPSSVLSVSVTSRVLILSSSITSVLQQRLSSDISAEKYSILQTPPLSSVSPTENVSNIPYSLVAIVAAAVSVLFCSATTIMLLIRSSRCRRKYKRRAPVVTHVNHGAVLTEEFVQQGSQSLQKSNGNVATGATASSNHFRIAEYASFNPEHISNTTTGISVIPLSQITSSIPQDHQTLATAETPSYATVQQKTGSPQVIQCSSTTAQTVEEVDFIIGSSTHLSPQETLMESNLFQTAKSSDQDSVVMPPNLKRNTSSQILSTNQSHSLKSSSSFFCNVPAMKTMPVDSTRSEMIKSSSFSKAGKASLPSTTKPLPQLPFKQPSTCTTVHKALTSPTSLKGNESLARSASQHSFSSGTLVLSTMLADQDNISVASEYEIPMRSDSFHRCIKKPSCTQLVPRSFSFSTNPDSSPIILPLSSAIFNTRASNNQAMLAVKGKSDLQCPSQGVQFHHTDKQPSLKME